MLLLPTSAPVACLPECNVDRGEKTYPDEGRSMFCVPEEGPHCSAVHIQNPMFSLSGASSQQHLYWPETSPNHLRSRDASGHWGDGEHTDNDSFGHRDESCCQSLPTVHINCTLEQWQQCCASANSPNNCLQPHKTREVLSHSNRL